MGVSVVNYFSIGAAVEITAGDRWKPVEKSKSPVRWMSYLGKTTGDNFLWFLIRNCKGHYITQVASKWLKNKPKMKIFSNEPHWSGLQRPKTPQLTPVPVARCASRVFIFTGDTNFPYFDHCRKRQLECQPPQTWNKVPEYLRSTT